MTGYKSVPTCILSELGSWPCAVVSVFFSSSQHAPSAHNTITIRRRATLMTTRTSSMRTRLALIVSLTLTMRQGWRWARGPQEARMLSSRQGRIDFSLRKLNIIFMIDEKYKRNFKCKCNLKGWLRRQQSSACLDFAKRRRWRKMGWTPTMPCSMLSPTRWRRWNRRSFRTSQRFRDAEQGGWVCQFSYKR